MQKKRKRNENTKTKDILVCLSISLPSSGTKIHEYII